MRPAADEAQQPIALTLEYDGPRRMRAGTLARFSLRCRARAALPTGARIAVAHRWPSDWGIAQSDDPRARDYLDVRASNAAGVRWWNARLHAWHPFDHIVFVELLDALGQNDTLAFDYGAAHGGSPGFSVQTFIEEASPFSLRWQPSPDMPWREFGREAIEIVGDDAHCLVVTAPSRVRAGSAFTLHLRAEDRWGNPARLDDEIEIEGPVRARARLTDAGFTRIDARIGTPGTFYIEARTAGASGLHALSNPIDVRSEAPMLVWWGDLHAQSVIGCGARSIDAYYRHAREFAAIDLASHQANCFLVSDPEWRETQAAAARHNAPGRFVTLLGVEWSGASSVGGDHNLYFPGDAAELRRCSHEFVADKSDVDRDLAHVDDLHAHYRGSDTLIAVHVGGRTADLQYHEPTLDRLLEVHSTHATSEWFLFDALRRGYRFGVIAGSDSVDGRPGNSHPGHMGVRNVRGGLTAVLAPELTRGAIWNALAQRRCYATTGERIVLDLRAGSASMGDMLEAARLPAFGVTVAGTAPLETIDFFRGAELVRSVDLLAQSSELSSKVRVAWRGTSAPGNWQRARMCWDGKLRVRGARIRGVEGFAFDTADEGVCDADAECVGWRSITAGDWDGVIIDLDAPERAELMFTTEPMNVRTTLRGLDAKGRRFDAASPERCIELKRLPAAMPATIFAGTFADPAPIPGEHAYWIRVRQTNGAYAWSTPIFVTLRPS
jgi:hypothetical protein